MQKTKFVSAFMLLALLLSAGASISVAEDLSAQEAPPGAVAQDDWAIFTDLRYDFSSIPLLGTLPPAMMDRTVSVDP
jgi:hypothetical protein